MTSWQYECGAVKAASMRTPLNLHCMQFICTTVTGMLFVPHAPATDARAIVPLSAEHARSPPRPYGQRPSYENMILAACLWRRALA